MVLREKSPTNLDSRSPVVVSVQEILCRVVVGFLLDILDCRPLSDSKLSQFLL